MDSTGSEKESTREGRMKDSWFVPIAAGTALFLGLTTIGGVGFSVLERFVMQTPQRSGRILPQAHTEQILEEAEKPVWERYADVNDLSDFVRVLAEDDRLDFQRTTHDEPEAKGPITAFGTDYDDFVSDVYQFLHGFDHNYHTEEIIVAAERVATQYDSGRSVSKDLVDLALRDFAADIEQSNRACEVPMRIALKAAAQADAETQSVVEQYIGRALFKKTREYIDNGGADEYGGFSPGPGLMGYFSEFEDPTQYYEEFGEPIVNEWMEVVEDLTRRGEYVDAHHVKGCVSNIVEIFCTGERTPDGIREGMFRAHVEMSKLLAPLVPLLYENGLRHAKEGDAHKLLQARSDLRWLSSDYHIRIEPYVSHLDSLAHSLPHPPK